MEESRLPSTDNNQGVQTNVPQNTTGSALPVSSYAQATVAYPEESLEGPGSDSLSFSQPQPFAPPAQTVSTPRPQSYSKRQAITASLVITLIVTMITGAALFSINKRSANKQAAVNGVESQEVSLRGDVSPETGLALASSTQALVVKGDIIARGDLKIESGNFLGSIKSSELTDNRDYQLPDSSGTLCLDNNNCNFVTPAQLADLEQQVGIATGLGRVSSVNGRAGAITLQGTANQVSVSISGGTVTFSTPQALNTSADVQFGTVTTDSVLGTSGNFSIKVGGYTYILPNQGDPDVAQTICTTGVTCATGGGQAIVLAPGFAQANSSTDSTIFINNTGGGNLLQLQENGSNTFVVSQNGDTAISGSLTVVGLTNGPLQSVGGQLTTLAINLANGDVSGVLPVDHGGTGAASLTQYGVVIGNGANPLTVATAGAANLCLISNSGAAPTFQVCPGTGSGSAAPGDGEYLTYATNATLSNERVLTAGTNIFLDNGTPSALIIDTVGDPIFNTSVTTPLLTSSGSLSITPGGSLTIGATNQQFTVQGNGSSVLAVSSSGNTTTVSFVAPTTNRSIVFPDEAGTVCLIGSSSCGFAGSGSGVTSLNGLGGALTIANATGVGSTITLQDASTSQKGIAQFNSTNFSASSGTINTVQGISTSASPQFAGLTLTGNLVLGTSGIIYANNLTQTAAGQDITIDATVNGITLKANNRTFILPNTGVATQTICTNGITCVAGGGQAVLLAPGSSQTNASATDESIFINNTGGADLLRLQGSGSDVFVVEDDGTTTINGAANLNGGATVTGTLNANTITPSSAMIVGATSQSITLQGNGNSAFVATGGGFTTGIGFNIGSGGTAPTGNITYQFRNDNTVSPGTYDVCTTAGNCAGVGGSVTTAGGTPGRLVKFSSSTAISDSIISESGSLITIAGSSLIQGSNGLTLGTASSVDGRLVFNNATNANTITFSPNVPASSATINIPGVGGTLAVSASGPLALDVNGNITCSTCLTSGGGGGSAGVSSLDGLTGALTLANSTGSSTTVTIDDASTSQKGIAQFNSTNFSAASGTINTIQNIATSSSPTFTNLNLQGTTGLTVGSTTNIGKTNYLDGTVSGFAATLQPVTLSANRTINIPNASGTLAVSASGNIQLSATGNLTTVNNPSFSTSVTTPILQSTGTLAITPGGALTVGVTSQQFTLQGNGSSSLTATTGANTTTVSFTTPIAGTTIKFPALTAGTYNICTDGGNCLGGSSGGANVNLSNLNGSSVAINTSLLSGSSSIDLGSNANPFRDLYLGGSATNNFRFMGTATAARTLTLDNAGGTIALLSPTTAQTGNLNTTGTITSGLINGQTIAAASVFTGNVTVQGLLGLNLGVSATQGGSATFYNAFAGGSVKLISAPTGGNWTLTMPAETGTLCTTAGSTACTNVYGTASGSTSYIQNQIAAPQTSSDFYISGTGRTSGSFVAPSFDIASAGTLSVGATTATIVNIGSASGTNTVNLRAGSGGVNVTAGLLNIGAASTTTSSLRLYNASSAFTTTIQTAAATVSRTLTIPDTGPSASPTVDTFCLLTLNNCSGTATTLQTSYDADINGSDARIDLTSNDGSILISNPLTGGSGSAYVLQIEQLNTAANKNGLLVSNGGGSGYSFRVNNDIASPNNKPFIIDHAGRVMIGGTTTSGQLLTLADEDPYIQFNMGSGSTFLGGLQLWGDVASPSVGQMLAATIGYEGGIMIQTPAGVNPLLADITLESVMAGGIYLINGNGSSAPTLSNANSTLTFSLGSNLLSVGTSTAYVMSTNFGIGDTTPVATLTVGSGGSGDRFQVAGATGNIQTTGDLALNGGDITSTGAMSITPGGGTNLNVALSGAGDFIVNTNQLYVDTSAARVGIGTTAPGATLEVNGDIYMSKEVARTIKIADTTAINTIGAKLSILGANSQDDLGGEILIQAGHDGNGTPTGDGGKVTIKGGTATSSSNSAATGGELLLQGGDGTYWKGGAVTIQGGAGANDLGGDVTIAGGTSSVPSVGGSVYINGGMGASTVGNVVIQAGFSIGPSAKLTATSSASTAGAVYSFDASNNGADGVLIDVQANNSTRYALKITSANGLFDRLTVLSNGSVGIGTAAPTSLLSIGTNNLFNVNSSGNILFSDDTHTITVNTETTSNGAGNELTISAGAADGTTTGAAGGELKLNGGAAAGSGNHAGGDITLQAGAATNTGLGGTIALTAGSSGTGGTGGAITLQSGANAALAYNNISTQFDGGKFFIGSTNPLNSPGKLDVSIGSVATNNALVVRGITGQTGDYFQVRTTNSATNGDVFAIIANGNVGIGNAAPASALTVGSGALFQVSSAGVITAVAGITSTANINIGNNIGLVMGASSASTLAYDSSDSRVELTGNGASLFVEDRFSLGVDAQTIADNGGGTAATLTLTPASGYVTINCADANGCNVTMGETGIKDGTVVYIINISSNTVNFADTSGVTELAGAFAAGQYSSIHLIYNLTVSPSVATWIEVSRSSN